MSFRAWLVAVVVVLGVGCADLSLPPTPPPPGPGTLQGRVVYAVPGRRETKAAGGASITLVGTSQQAMADAETGRFVLDGLRARDGQVLIRFDSDGDGAYERQRLIDLVSVGAGPGIDLELGDVSLGRNATVVGTVRRGDTPTATGHAGIGVFVPGGPWATLCGDDGSYVLEGLPEGSVRVSFFLSGFAVDARETVLAGGQETRLSTVTLLAAPAGLATVSGRVMLADGTPASGARLRFVAGALETLTTAADDGAFSAQGVTAGLYQVGVEREGAASLRLYNVLLSSGANALGELTLVPGTSTALPLDGGLTIPDAGPGPVLAFIDGQTIVAPGGTVSLTGARSTGSRPLTFHWSTDAGTVFTPNDGLTPTTSFTAPTTPSIVTVALTVTDAESRRSAPATRDVHVGTAPTVSVTGGGNVASGTTVTLTAFGTSTDGTGIDHYRWQQITGPFTPELWLLSAPMLSFATPVVAVPTPLTVEVVAVSGVGISSAPVSVTVVLQPAGVSTLRVVVTPSGGGRWQADGGSIVRLTASIDGQPDDGGYRFAWTPAALLSNPDHSVTEFVTPRVDGVAQPLSFQVTATSLADGGTFSGSTQVVLTDARPAVCVPTLSPYALRFDCDEDVVLAGVDAGLPGGGPFPPGVPTGGARWLMVLLPGGAPDAGVVEFSANDLADNVTTFSGLVARGAPQGLITSTSSSVVAPGARWSFLSAGTRLVGRRATSTDRMAWTVGNVDCLQASCVGAESFGLSIPGAPQPAWDTVLTAGDQLYVAVSTNNEVSAFGPGGWREVSWPKYVALGSRGGKLALVANGASAMGVPQVLINDNPDGGFSPPVTLSTTQKLSAGAWAHLEDLGAAGLVLTFIDVTGMPKAVRFTSPDGTTWTELPTPVAPLVQELRTVTFADGATPRTAFVARDGTTSTAYFETSTGTVTTPLGDNLTQFDLAAFGDRVLLTGSEGGVVRLGVLSRSMAPVMILHPNPLNAAEGWNGANTASSPTVTVGPDGTIGLAWQEQQADGGWRMAGRLIR